MSNQHRDRGHNRHTQQQQYPSRNSYEDQQRYPGAGTDEFSQFGGPQHEGYRDYAGEGSQRSSERYYQNEGRGYSGRQGNQYGTQRGEAPGPIPSGYPDYSEPRNYGYEGRADPSGGYRGQSGNQRYSAQERGNMDSALDRDWGQYGQQPPQSGYDNRNYGGSQPGGRSQYGQSGQYGDAQRGYTGSSQYTSGSPSYGQRQSQGTGYGGGQYGGGSEYAGDYGVGSRYGSSSQGGTTGQSRTRSGPKGYQRSDERVREQIVERLMDSSVDLSDVEVEVKNGEVTLSGTVCSRQCRHEIEDIADSIWGVKDVNNNVRVKSGSMSGMNDSAETGASRPSDRSTTSSSTSSTNRDSGSTSGTQSGKNR